MIAFQSAETLCSHSYLAGTVLPFDDQPPGTSRPRGLYIVNGGSLRGRALGASAAHLELLDLAPRHMR